MCRLLFSFILLVATMPCIAQKNSFGLVNYAIPSGYDLTKHENVLTYYKEDKATGAYCNFFIYNTMPGHGSTKNDFDFAWANLMQKPFKVTGTATIQSEAILKGWKFLIGNTKYSDNNIATLALLISFSGENKMQGICILSNSDKYKGDIESFIAAIDVIKDLSPSSPIQNSEQKKSINPNTQPNAKPSTIKYDLWMSHKLKLGGRLDEMSFQYVILSTDNRCLFYFPEKGLNNLEVDFPRSSNSWGKVVEQGDKFVLNNDKFGKMELYKKAVNAMSRYADSKSGDYYKKCKPVDGIHIEGAYSPDVSLFKNKATVLDKIIYDPNKRPIIFFKKDGTYINEGITFSNLTFGDDFAIGKGTYELKNFSAILTTQSGRKLQVSFAGIQDANPAAGADGYIINNNLFYKLDSSYITH